MQTNSTYQSSVTNRTATHFTHQGTAYSATHVEDYTAAKVGRGLRASKLALLAKNL